MRKLIVICFMFVACCCVCMLLNGCAEKKPAQEQNVDDSLDIDSSAIDDMEDIISETPMPKSAEELFDDFFFNFAGNRKLQQRRIVFPLTVYNNGREEKIKAEDWKMERFFMQNSFYTLIFDNYRQMAAQRDTSVSHVLVEQIDLDRSRVKQFCFERKSNEWRMTSINNSGYEGMPNESFLKFYNRFVTDSLFQVQSIADPLEFSGPDPDDELATMEGMLLPEQWTSFAPPLPKGIIYNIVYGEQSKGSNQKILLVQGISNGYQTELVFQKKGGQWKLAKLTI